MQVILFIDSILCLISSLKISIMLFFASLEVDVPICIICYFPCEVEEVVGARVEL